MHKRLAHRYPTEVVPGVTSISAASAALGQPLVERDEVLTVLPGTLPRAELAAPPGRHRLRGRAQARPHVRQRPRRGRRRAAAAGLLRRARDDGRAAHRRPGRRRPRLGALLRDRPAPGRGRRLPTRPAGRGAPAGRGGGRRHRPGRSRLADPAGRGRRSPKPTTSSATAPTWTACRPTRARPGTPATTASRPTAPRTRSTSPPPGAASRSCRRATRACSPWPQRCWRSRPRTKYADVPVRVLPGVTASSAVAAAVGRPAGPRPRRDLAVGPAQAVGGRRRAARGRRRARTWRSRSTTRGRRPGPGSWAQRGTCCWSTAARTRRWCWAATSAARASG